MALAFDIRDNFHGSAITYGTITLTRGELNLDASLLSTDSSTAKTEVYFTKLKLEFANMQHITPNINACVKATIKI